MFFRSALSAVLDEMRSALPTDTDENKKNSPPSAGARPASTTPSPPSNKIVSVAVDKPAAARRSRRRRRPRATQDLLAKRSLNIEEDTKIVDHLKSRLRRLGYAVLSDLHEGYVHVRGQRLSKITLGVDCDKMMLQLRKRSSKDQPSHQDVSAGRRRSSSSSSRSSPNTVPVAATPPLLASKDEPSL